MFVYAILLFVVCLAKSNDSGIRIAICVNEKGSKV